VRSLQTAIGAPAALAGTTALVPVRAEAGPVVPFISGLIASTTPLYLGGAGLAGFGAGVAFGSSVFGGILVRGLLSLGLSAIASALQPRPNLPKPAARMANFAQPVSYAQWVFGRARTGGPLGLTGFADSRRFYVVILAAHPIEGVVEHWIDEWTVGVDGAVTDFLQPNLLTQSDGAFSAPDDVAEHGRIEVLRGQPGQTAVAGLVAALPEVTAEVDFAGLACGVLWASRPSPDDFTTIYPRGS